MKRFFGKTLIWLARVVVVLIVLLIIFYAEEDWRGARDWAAGQKELQAKGETLDLRQRAPAGKPENDLTKVPIFAELFQKDYPRARLYNLGIFHATVDSYDSLPGNDLNSVTNSAPVPSAGSDRRYIRPPLP